MRIHISQVNIVIQRVGGAKIKLDSSLLGEYIIEISFSFLLITNTSYSGTDVPWMGSVFYGPHPICMMFRYLTLTLFRKARPPPLFPSLSSLIIVCFGTECFVFHFSLIFWSAAVYEYMSYSDNKCRISSIIRRRPL